MKTYKFLRLPLIACLFLLITSATIGDKETERIHNAANVLKDFSSMKEKIPHDLIAKYEGIVIIPKLINAGMDKTCPSQRIDLIAQNGIGENIVIVRDVFKHFTGD